MFRQDGGKFLLTAQEPCLIQLLLLWRHLGHQLALHLIGQLCQHILFQPPQDKRSDVTAQFSRRAPVFVPHDGNLVAGAELWVREQIPRHEEIKDGPKLCQGIFDGRTGEGKIPARLEALHRFGILGGGIFDVLGLVQKDVAEGFCPIVGNVPL